MLINAMKEIFLDHIRKSEENKVNKHPVDVKNRQIKVNREFFIENHLSLY